MSNGVQWFDLIQRAGAVQRFHVERLIIPQDDAQHSFNAALIAHHIASEYNEYHYNSEFKGAVSPYKCVMYMLLHDIGELYTGDTPGPFKSANKDASKELKKVEKEWLHNNVGDDCKDFSLKDNLNEWEQIIVNFVDEYECYLKVIHEYKMGNSFMEDKANRIYDSLLTKAYDSLLTLKNNILSDILTHILIDTNNFYSGE